MMHKCIWCNKESEQIKEITVLAKNRFGVKPREVNCFVCSKHEEKFRKFNDRVRRYSLVFIGLVIISLIALMGVNCWRGDNGIATYLSIASIAFMGLVFIVFPFSTPETVLMIGFAKSIIVVRIIGGIFFALGAIGLVLALLYG